MITTISSVKELNKILRKELIAQSQLNSNYVLNALSTYGETLDKLLSNKVYDSYETKDAVLLFQLFNRNNESDFSFTEKNGTITYNKSYELKIIIYGNASSDIANKISSRFRTEKVRNDLQNLGVYLESISDPESINEFKNEVMWFRTDISIFITSEFSYQQTSEDSDFDILSKINIIK